MKPRNPRFSRTCRFCPELWHDNVELGTLCLSVASSCGLQTLTKRLAQLNDALSTKHGAITDYEKIIHETEQAYSKIVESSHTLLSVLKKEASSIGKRATTTDYHHA